MNITEINHLGSAPSQNSYRARIPDWSSWWFRQWSSIHWKWFVNKSGREMVVPFSRQRPQGHSIRHLYSRWWCSACQIYQCITVRLRFHFWKENAKGTWKSMRQIRNMHSPGLSIDRSPWLRWHLQSEPRLCLPVHLWWIHCQLPISTRSVRMKNSSLHFECALITSERQGINRRIWFFGNPNLMHSLTKLIQLPSTYTSIVVQGFDQYWAENIQRTFIVSSGAQGKEICLNSDKVRFRVQRWTVQADWRMHLSRWIHWYVSYLFL